MRFFPPIVTGPIIIAIGLNLSSSAINNCAQNWWIAMVAIVIIIACQHLGQGHDQDHPDPPRRHRLLCCRGHLRRVRPRDPCAERLGTPSGSRFRSTRSETVFGLLTSGNVDSHLLLTSVITIVPLSLATMVEHIGDMSAISSTCNRNYIENPGLHRTLMGDGLATTPGSPLRRARQHHLRRKHRRSGPEQDLRPARHPHRGQSWPCCFSFSPKFAAIISSMPGGTIGGVSLVLYGMISAVGVRNVVENKVDFTEVQQRPCRGSDPGPLHRHQLLLRRLSGARPHQPVWSGGWLHRRYRPQRHHAR